MKYNRLGKTNLRVSALCLGTMMFGDQTDAMESARIVDHAREQGVNFIDTADVYSLGISEQITGGTIRSERDWWVLATKIGNKMSLAKDAPNQDRYSRKWMMQECDASLTRLGTDYIDIYYLHRDFAGINLEEIVRAMDDLVRCGKIRYFGLSNFSAWRTTQIVGLCKEMNVSAPVVCQPHYNLLNRVPEVELLPACHAFGIGVVPYSPLARGVLTGKYLPGLPPVAGSRGTTDARFVETEFREESLRIAQSLKIRSDELGVQLGQYATAWLLGNRLVSSVIAGPRTLAQWQDYLGALDLVLGDEDETLVDALVSAGHASTPGYTDPAFPVQGRLVDR